MAKKKVSNVSKGSQGTLKETLEGFLFWKQAQGLSETTLKDYRTHVNIFFNRYPAAFNPQELKPSLFEYMAQPVKPATFNLQLIYLRTFFDWCIQEGIYTENHLAGFKRRKAEPRIVNIDVDILTRLIPLPKKGTFAGLRDFTLILLTLDTGVNYHVINAKAPHYLSD